MLQEDLEQEQVRVNSLTHMVVVVDEASGDRATAALEEQLKVRGFSFVHGLCHLKEFIAMQGTISKFLM